MAWGSSFDVPVSGKAIADAQAQADAEWKHPITTHIEEIGKVIVAAIPKVYNNVPPTHDPYTNPDAIIYYECNCGQILDPGTKRFAELNNCASKAGWKIRFSDSGYTPYCVECGKGVE